MAALTKAQRDALLASCVADSRAAVSYFTSVIQSLPAPGSRTAQQTLTARQCQALIRLIQAVFVLVPNAATDTDTGTPPA